MALQLMLAATLIRSTMSGTRTPLTLLACCSLHCKTTPPCSGLRRQIDHDTANNNASSTRHNRSKSVYHHDTRHQSFGNELPSYPAWTLHTDNMCQHARELRIDHVTRFGHSPSVLQLRSHRMVRKYSIRHYHAGTPQRPYEHDPRSVATYNS